MGPLTRGQLEDFTRDDLVRSGQEVIAELGRRGLRETESRESRGRVQDAVEAAAARHLEEQTRALRADLEALRKDRDAYRKMYAEASGLARLQPGTVAAKWAVFHRTAGEKGWPSGDVWHDTGLRDSTAEGAAAQWIGYRTKKNLDWQETDIRLVLA